MTTSLVGQSLFWHFSRTINLLFTLFHKQQQFLKSLLLEFQLCAQYCGQAHKKLPEFTGIDRTETGGTSCDLGPSGKSTFEGVVLPFWEVTQPKCRRIGQFTTTYQISHDNSESNQGSYPFHWSILIRPIKVLGKTASWFVLFFREHRRCMLFAFVYGCVVMPNWCGPPWGIMCGTPCPALFPPPPALLVAHHATASRCHR